VGGHSVLGDYQLGGYLTVCHAPCYQSCDLLFALGEFASWFSGLWDFLGR
jgi:hypothetical protein